MGNKPDIPPGEQRAGKRAYSGATDEGLVGRRRLPPCISRRTLTRYLWWSCLALLALEGAGLWHLKVLPFSRIEVINTSDIRDIYWVPTEVGGPLYTSPRSVTHVVAAPNYGIFPTIRETITQAIPELGTMNSDLERIVALRKWARARFSFGSSLGDYAMFDYRKSFQPDGESKALCDAFATLFVGASLSLGIPARLVHLNTSSEAGFQGHYIAEAWVEELEKWAAVDPLYNTIYTLGGIPASTLEIHNAFFIDQMSGVPVVERNGAKTNPDPARVEGLRSWYAHFQVVNRTDFDEYGIPLWGKKLQFINWIDEVSPPLGDQERVLRIVTLVMLPGILVAKGAFLTMMTVHSPPLHQSHIKS